MSEQMEGIRQNLRQEFDIILGRLILGALDELTGRRQRPPSRVELVRFIARKPVRGAEGAAPSLEGLLDRLKHDDVRCMVEILETLKLVEAVGPDGVRVALTAEGRKYLRAFIIAPTGVVEAVLDRRDENTALYVGLRALRFDLARTLQVPAYQVFHDRTLRMIAARRPSSIDELRAIPGIGDARAARYGRDVLRCLEALGAQTAAASAAGGASPATAGSATPGLPGLGATPPPASSSLGVAASAPATAPVASTSPPAAPASIPARPAAAASSGRPAAAASPSASPRPPGPIAAMLGASALNERRQPWTLVPAR